MIEVAEAISVFPQPTGQLITQSMADEELAGLRDELRDFTRAENARLNEIKELLRSHGTPEALALMEQLNKAPREISRQVQYGELSSFEALEVIRDLCHQATILLATKERATRPVSRVTHRAQVLIQEMTKYSSMKTSEAIKILSSLEGVDIDKQQALRAMRKATELDQSLKFEKLKGGHARLRNTQKRAWG
jgi:hypothetical protein